MGIISNTVRMLANFVFASTQGFSPLVPFLPLTIKTPYDDVGVAF